MQKIMIRNSVMEFKDQQDEFAYYTSEANKAFSSRDYNIARDLYKKALAITPDSAAGHFNMGNVLKALGDRKAALKSYDRAIKEDSDFVKAYINKGILLHEEAKYDRAIACYEKATMRNGTTIEAYYNKASSLTSLKRYQDAIGEYKKVLELDTHYSAALYNIAMLYKMVDDLGSGVDYYITWKLLSPSKSVIEEYEPLARAREMIAAIGQLKDDFSNLLQDFNVLDIKDQTSYEFAIIAKKAGMFEELCQKFTDHGIYLVDEAHFAGDYRLAIQLAQTKRYHQVINAPRSLYEKMKAKSLDENILQEQINSISDEDIVSTTVFNIRSLLNIPHSFLGSPERKLLRWLREAGLPKQPAEMIQYKFEEIKSAIFGRPCGKRSDMFKDIHGLMQKLDKFKKSFTQSLEGKNNESSISNKIYIELDRLYNFYDEYISQAGDLIPRERNKYLRPKICFSGEKAGDGPAFFRYLKDEFIKEMLPFDQDHKLKKSIFQSGVHVVLSLNGVYYKHKPLAPGVEFQVDSLGKLMDADYVTPPTCLVNIKDRQGANHPFLASKGIVGTELSFLMEQRSDMLSKIDARSFGAMILLSLLVNPRDAHPGNYLVEYIKYEDDAKIPDEEDNIEKVYIKGIDNDIAFADSVIKVYSGRNAGKYLINVRNVLYFFPQMHDNVDTSLRQKFLHTLPEVTLIKWLGILYRKNLMYENLKHLGVFTEEDYDGKAYNQQYKTNPNRYKGDDYDLYGMMLPIMLRKGVAVKIYHKLQKLKHLISKESLTYQDMFAGVENLAAKYYQKVQRDIESDAKYKDKTIGEKILLCLDRVYRPTAIATGSAMEFDSMLSSKSCNSLTKSVLRSVREFDFLYLKNQTIVEATHEFIKAINFNDLHDVDKEKLIWNEIITELHFIRELQIRGSVAMGNRVLEHCLKFKHLTKVVLLGLEDIDIGGVVSFIKKWSVGKSLVIGDCKSLSGYIWEDLHVWDKLLEECREAGIKFFVRIGNHNYDIHQGAVTILLELAQTGQHTPGFLDYLAQARHLTFAELLPQEMTVLDIVCAEGHGELLKFLLENYNIDIMHQHVDSGYSALHYAARAGQIKAAEILLEYATKVGLLDKILCLTARNDTALDKAVKKGHAKLAEILYKEYDCATNNLELLDALLSERYEEKSDMRLVDQYKGMILAGDAGEVYEFVES